jgi:hypothetical protein
VIPQKNEVMENLFLPFMRIYAGRPVWVLVRMTEHDISRINTCSRSGEEKFSCVGYACVVNERGKSALGSAIRPERDSGID